MSNMFTDHHKRIPKNLSECIHPDGTVTDLRKWAEWIEGLGKALFIFLVIIGILFTIVITVAAAAIDGGTGFIAFLMSAISWGISAFAEYIAYHAVALLISSLASINHNTAISANVALYEAAKDLPPEPEVPYAAPVHMPPAAAFYAPQPVQPQSRPAAAPEWHPVAETTVQRVGTSNVQCMNCGRIQFSGNSVCNRCGARFIK